MRISTPMKQQSKGYRGVATSVHPLLPSEVRDKCLTETLEYLTMRVKNIDITTLYISPRAKADEEQSALKRVHCKTGYEGL